MLTSYQLGLIVGSQREFALKVFDENGESGPWYDPYFDTSLKLQEICRNNLRFCYGVLDANYFLNDENPCGIV